MTFCQICYSSIESTLSKERTIEVTRRVNRNRSEGLDDDPYETELAEIRTLIRASGLSFYGIAARATQRGYYISSSTISNLWYGDTMRPQDYTIRAILIGIDYRRPIVPLSVETVSGEVKPEPHWPGNIRKRREAKRAKRKTSGKSRKKK